MLVLAGATIGWVFGDGVGSLIGSVGGVILARVGHQLQQRTFLLGIHNAVCMGNVERVGYLLRKNPSLVNTRDASGNTHYMVQFLRESVQRAREIVSASCHVL